MLRKEKLPLPSKDYYAEALDAMLPYGFSRKAIISSLRRIVELYNKCWDLIRDNNYAVLLECLLEQQGSSTSDVQQQQQHQENWGASSSSVQRKRSSCTVQEDDYALTPPKRQEARMTLVYNNEPDAARSSAIKLGKQNGSNYLSSVHKKCQELKAAKGKASVGTEAEPLTEVEPSMEVEPLTEVDQLLNSPMEVEPLTEVEPPMEIEPLTEVEPPMEVEPLTEVEPPMEVEPLTEVEPPTEVEEVSSEKDTDVLQFLALYEEDSADGNPEVIGALSDVTEADAVAEEEHSLISEVQATAVSEPGNVSGTGMELPAGATKDYSEDNLPPPPPLPPGVIPMHVSSLYPEHKEEFPAPKV